MQLNVNTDAVVAFTNKLEKLNRAAFPVAVRTALNSAAFDMKKNTLIQSADDEFVKRKPNFFKANSKVIPAKGFDINTMQSAVGFFGNSQAVDDLEHQEKGGTIGSRSFIPLKTARTGNNNNKMVRANARLKQIKIVNTANATGKNDKEKFVKSVIHAGVGGHVLSELNGNGFVWRVNSLKRTKDGNFKLTPLYSFKDGRKVTVDKTGFVRKAAEQSSEKIEKFYIEAAIKQFQKAIK